MNESKPTQGMTDNTQSDVVEAILAWLRSDYAKGSDDWCDAADAFADYIEENILPRFASLSTKDDGLVGELEKALPLLEDLETGQDCEDYAYAKGKGFQAMTYCPAAFEALRCIPRVLTALRSDRDAVVEELGRPFVTCRAEFGDYYVKLKYETLSEAQEAHAAIVKALKGDR